MNTQGMRFIYLAGDGTELREIVPWRFQSPQEASRTYGRALFNMSPDLLAGRCRYMTYASPPTPSEILRLLTIRLWRRYVD